MNPLNKNTLNISPWYLTWRKSTTPALQGKGGLGTFFFSILISLLIPHSGSAQNYRLFLQNEPLVSSLETPGSVGLYCDTAGLVCILTEKNQKMQLDTLGIYSNMKWVATQFAEYQKAESEEAYARLYQKRLTRSASSRVKVIFPVPTDFLNPNIELTWRPFQDTKNYLVFLTDRFNHILARKTTSDTTLQLNLAEYNLQKGVCYFWFVEPESISDSRSDEICLTWIRDESGLFVQEEIQKIELIQGIDKATRHIMKASVYEQHKLFIEALREYKGACQEFPEADDLKRMYGMFLVRIGVIKSVRELWN